jgi:hypothetical protein
MADESKVDDGVEKAPKHVTVDEESPCPSAPGMGPAGNPSAGTRTAAPSTPSGADKAKSIAVDDDSVLPIDREAAWQDRDRATDSGTASRFLFADILQKSSDADLRFGIENGMG